MTTSPSCADRWRASGACTDPATAVAEPLQRIGPVRSRRRGSPVGRHHRRGRGCRRGGRSTIAAPWPRLPGLAAVLVARRHPFARAGLRHGRRGHGKLPKRSCDPPPPDEPACQHLGPQQASPPDRASGPAVPRHAGRAPCARPPQPGTDEAMAGEREAGQQPDAARQFVQHRILPRSEHVDHAKAQQAAGDEQKRQHPAPPRDAGRRHRGTARAMPLPVSLSPRHAPRLVPQARRRVAPGAIL